MSNNKSIRQPTVLANNKTTNKTINKSIRQPTVLAAVQATVNVCNEANNIITDQSIESIANSEKDRYPTAADAATKKQSEWYDESKSSLVAIDNDAISLPMMRNDQEEIAISLPMILTEEEKTALAVSAFGDAVRSIAGSEDSSDNDDSDDDDSCAMSIALDLFLKALVANQEQVVAINNLAHAEDKNELIINSSLRSLRDLPLVADRAEVKVLNDTIDADHNPDLLVHTSPDSAVELSLLADKEEDEIHIIKEVPLTWPNGPIPSFLVTGPTDSCSASDACNAMPKSTSPDFLQVPKTKKRRAMGRNPYFYNVRWLPVRRSPRKPQPFRPNLGDSELANAFLDNDDTVPVLDTSLNDLLNFDVLADWEKVEVPKNAAPVADVDAGLRTHTGSTPAPQCSRLPTSTDCLAPTVTMTGPSTSGSRPAFPTHIAKKTLINSSSVASNKTSVGSGKAKIGRKSSSSAASKIKSIGSSKTTTIERVSRIPTARQSNPDSAGCAPNLNQRRLRCSSQQISPAARPILIELIRNATARSSAAANKEASSLL
ncbi:hypothetical protein A4X06_0g3715 [Tilletia controversa]|uniref:Uncharacterized protein n=2 Tax=Tilletia TaxID=13289 RepID=A0A8X7MTZ2_9BASI|nr:hypothetical protein A4X06_0g3715 [Tilletia controversa]